MIDVPGYGIKKELCILDLSKYPKSVIKAISPYKFLTKLVLKKKYEGLKLPPDIQIQMILAHLYDCRRYDRWLVVPACWKLYSPKMPGGNHLKPFFRRTVNRCMEYLLDNKYVIKHNIGNQAGFDHGVYVNNRYIPTDKLWKLFMKNNFDEY